MIARSKLIEENVPLSMEPWYTEDHPFQHLHGPLKDPYKVVEYGEKLGLGSREYGLVDVMPVEEISARTAGLHQSPLRLISAPLRSHGRESTRFLPAPEGRSRPMRITIAIEGGHMKQTQVQPQMRLSVHPTRPAL